MEVEKNYAAEEIEEMLNQKRYRELKDIFSSIEPADIALIFDDIHNDELPLVYRLLPKDMAAEVFVEMNNSQQEFLISAFSDQELRAVMDEMYVDDAVDIIEEMPANVVRRILKQADPEMRLQINEILKYPDDSAGSIMTTEYVNLRKDMTVEESFSLIRSTGEDKETIYTCYVTDENRYLTGVISVRRLLLSDNDALIGDIMDTNIIYATTLTDKEDVAKLFSKYDYMSVPVVDQEKRLVGIVTVDDAMDVLQDENTEDMEKMAGVAPSEKSYLETSVFETWKSRIPWLLVLMISATFTGGIISHYEDALGAFTILTAFIPMLMDTGGNASCQASVSVIRALALGDVHYSDTLRVILKESMVAIACGITLAAANFAKMLLIDRTTVTIACVVCLTLIVTVFVSKIIGCILPIGASRIGLDPAAMASPFITTIVDAVSLIVYFQIATHILQI